MIDIIANRYAEALFQLSEEENITKEIYNELQDVVDTIKSNKELGKDGNFKTGEFTGLSILRFCLIGLSVLIPALLVKFTGDTTNNYRFLYVLISLVSFATVIGLFGAHSHGE